MRHQIIGTAWSGAVATVTVEAFMSGKTLVSSRAKPVGMISDILKLVLIT